MILNKENLNRISTAEVPGRSLFGLPEKVLQFGTGVLLRGLPDYFIDKANKQGLFNGRVVVVKSTTAGPMDAFEEQDGLYTVCVRGIAEGRNIEKNVVAAAISRVLHAQTAWKSILEVAASPALEIIISNTTESGIVFTEETIGLAAPATYPAKLLAVLLHRYKTFNGAPGKGLVILPTELISDNGCVLKDAVIKLAEFNQLGADFKAWLTNKNKFCNTLVDRIVPGTPEQAELLAMEAELGYKDALLVVTEAYKLWAIEGDATIREVLSFAAADEGVVIAQDITLHKEMKLRLLNGTHSLCCGAAYLSGFKTVSEAMQAPTFAYFVKGLMHEEIAPAIPCMMDPAEATAFAGKVFDRFQNPNIDHQWLSICQNYTMKLSSRVIPLLQQYYRLFNQPPAHIAFGFAAYIKYMFVTENTELNTAILSDKNIWGIDITIFPGFELAVKGHLQTIEAEGTKAALQKFEAKSISTP